MDLLRRLLSVVRNLFHGRRVERDLDAELRGYIDLLTDEKIAGGMAPERARRDAHIELGGVEQLKEEVRTVRAGALLERIARDVRHSLRTLWRSPGFAVVTILTLAIGVGANTVVLSALRQLLWNPIDTRHADELVTIQTTSSRNFHQALTGQATTLQAVAAFQTLRVTAGVQGRPTAALAMFASDNYFDVAGVQPVIGRALDAGVAGSAEPAALLGHAFWRTQLGGRDDVIGSTLTVNGVPVTVAGVMPRGFRGTRLAAPPDLYLPLDAVVLTKVLSPRSPNARWLQLLGRRQPGATIEGISTEATAIMRAVVPGAGAGFPLVVRPAIDASIDRAAVMRTLSAGGIAAVLLLLIGAVNIGSLASARATARRPEIGLRIAIGASRGALIQQFATESVLLALGGLSVGLVLAVWVSSALTSVQLTRGVPLVFDASPDAITMAVAAAAALATGFCCTLLPMLRVLRIDLATVVKSESGRQATAAAAPLRSALVVMQLGAALALAICGVLLLQTVRQQQSIGLGIDEQHVILVDPRLHGQLTQAELRTLHERIMRGLSEVAGVRHVSRSHLPPLTVVAFQDSMRIGGAPDVDINYNEVDPANFATLGIPVRGATFSRPGAPEAVVNESFAARYWPGSDALGQSLQLGSEQVPRTVVGIARDSKYGKVTEPPTPVVYLPIPERVPSTALFLVRVDGEAERRLDAVRAAMQELAPGFAVDVRTMSHHLREHLAQPRAVATLVGVLSAIACVLTMVGLFGLLMYLASRRKREIAIRLALGASPRAARVTLMRTGLGLAAAGALTGLMLAALGARLLAGSLYGVRPFEPAIYAGAAVGLLALAAIASYIPAWQASRVDPLQVLRHE